MSTKCTSGPWSNFRFQKSVSLDYNRDTPSYNMKQDYDDFLEQINISSKSTRSLSLCVGIGSSTLIIELLEKLKNHGNLEEIELLDHSKKITDDIITKFNELISVNTNIKLISVPGIFCNKIFLEIIKNHRSLEGLIISETCNEDYIFDILDMLKTNNHIKKLSIQNTLNIQSIKKLMDVLETSNLHIFSYDRMNTVSPDSITRIRLQNASLSDNLLNEINNHVLLLDKKLHNQATVKNIGWYPHFHKYCNSYQKSIIKTIMMMKYTSKYLIMMSNELLYIIFRFYCY